MLSLSLAGTGCRLLSPYCRLLSLALTFYCCQCWAIFPLRLLSSTNNTYVEYYIDGMYMGRNNVFVPTRGSRLWISLWPTADAKCVLWAPVEASPT